MLLVQITIITIPVVVMVVVGSESDYSNVNANDDEYDDIDDDYYINDHLINNDCKCLFLCLLYNS